MVARLAISFGLTCFLLADGAFPAQKKKEKPEPTQVLDLPQDPPHAVVADTERLVFHMSPLSAKGLLSQQIRDGIKALRSAAGRGTQIIKIRAFVAGSGDMRRVPMIVSEIFGDRRQPIPAVSVVQVGSLPLSGAQVLLESIGVQKRPVNPNGIAFVAGQPSKVEDAVGPLKAALGGMEPRSITCFLASLELVDKVRGQIAASYPKAVASYVQLRRDTLGDFVECEAIAAAAQAPASPVEFRNSKESAYSDVAVVGPGKIVITGTQLAFGAQEEDIRLAFGRLEKDLSALGAKLSDTVMTRLYPLSSAAADAARKVRFEFYDAKKPPASTLLIFEGLPSLDALLGIQVFAVPSGTAR